MRTTPPARRRRPALADPAVAAVAWVPGNGRFGLSAGAGWMVPDSGSSALAWGVSGALSVPLLRRLADLGTAVFVGAGGPRPPEAKETLHNLAFSFALTFTPTTGGVPEPEEGQQ